VSKEQELPPVYPNSEDFEEERGERLNTETVRDVLVGEPAHETVKMPRQPMIPIRDETVLAL
jgi:hypothetical protein